MPFLTEELWQRPPRRPGDDTCSITIAEYPEYESLFRDPKSEVAYELVLGCSKGIRSLLADYAVKDEGMIYIAALNGNSYETVSAQQSAIEALSGKTPVRIQMLKVGDASPPDCAVFPVSADANVYLEVKSRIRNATTETKKFKAKVEEARREQLESEAIKAELDKVQDKDVTDAMRAAENRRQNIEARLRALHETVAMFEKMEIQFDYDPDRAGVLSADTCSLCLFWFVPLRSWFCL